MYGFCVAAHLRLPHRVAYGLMISDTNMVAKEGWPLVDAMGESSCDPSSVDKFRPELPPVVHYCQFYRVRTHMFGKRHPITHDFFSMPTPTPELPPRTTCRAPAVELRVQPGESREASKEDHVLAEYGGRSAGVHVTSPARDERRAGVVQRTGTVGRRNLEGALRG
ncbi:unnamed protein product [Ascophyllum nodosum]